MKLNNKKLTDYGYITKAVYTTAVRRRIRAIASSKSVNSRT